MRVVAVARKDLKNVSQSLLVQGVIGILVVVVVAVVGLPGLFSDFFSARAAFQASTSAASTVVPIVALVAGYLSVAGERQSGRVRVLLSLPPTRRDVVLGKFLSRAGIVLAGVVVAFLFGGIVAVSLYDAVPLDVVALSAVLTMLLAATFVGIAVGISAMVHNRARAVAAAVGLFMLTVVLWGGLMLGLQVLLEGVPFDPAQQPTWFLLLRVFPPSAAYSRLSDDLVGPSPPGDALVLSEPAMVLLLLAWLVVPLATGYWRFRRADLG